MPALAPRHLLACAVEPLLGMHYGAMHHSPALGLLVSLWIQPHHGGRFKVDAIAPADGYRVLYRQVFTDAALAIQAWRAQWHEHYGMHAPA